MEQVFFTSKAHWAAPSPTAVRRRRRISLSRNRHLRAASVDGNQPLGDWKICPGIFIWLTALFPMKRSTCGAAFSISTLSTYKRDIAERLRPFLEKVYASTDEHLGFLLSKRPESAYFAVISDHGIQGMNKRVTLNQALQQGGLLSLDNQGRVDLGKTPCSILQSTTVTC